MSDSVLVCLDECSSCFDLYFCLSVYCSSCRHVIVLGDINTSHKMIDHCEPDKEVRLFTEIDLQP